MDPAIGLSSIPIFLHQRRTVAALQVVTFPPSKDRQIRMLAPKPPVGDLKQILISHWLIAWRSSLSRRSW